MSKDYTQDPDCQLAYLMNVDENPLTDSSQNTNTGALKAAGSPNFTASGKYGGAYVWDSVSGDDWANAGSDASIDDLGSLSVVAWLIAETGARRVIDTLDGGGNGWFIDASAGVGNDFMYFEYETTTATSVNAGSADASFTRGEFYHHAVTYDGSLNSSGIKHYFNGVETGSYQLTSNGGTAHTDDSANRKFIGNRPAEDRTWDSTMDELGIFSDVLTLAEINEIMDDGLDGSQFIKPGGHMTTMTKYW